LKKSATASIGRATHECTDHKARVRQTPPPSDWRTGASTGPSGLRRERGGFRFLKDAWIRFQYVIRSARRRSPQFQTKHGMPHQASLYPDVISAGQICTAVENEI
jgi:hypothetical protein